VRRPGLRRLREPEASVTFLCGVMCAIVVLIYASYLWEEMRR